MKIHVLIPELYTFGRSHYFFQSEFSTVFTYLFYTLLPPLDLGPLINILEDSEGFTYLIQ